MAPHLPRLSLGDGGLHASVPPRAQDHDAVIAAVLQSQPDIAAERREYLRHYPEEASFLSGLFDYRLCVSPRTASVDDFGLSTVREVNQSSPKARAAVEGSGRSYRIAREGFPSFLRRKTLVSICPSGTLLIGNPRFEGDTAQVFVENRCSGLCGWGGELVLRKVRGRWRVQGWVHQWQA